MKRILVLCSVLTLAACDSTTGSKCWTLGVKNLVSKIYQENRVPTATNFRVYDVVEEGIADNIFVCSAKIDYTLDETPETVAVEYTVKTLNAEHGPIIRVQFTDIK